MQRTARSSKHQRLTTSGCTQQRLEGGFCSDQGCGSTQATLGRRLLHGIHVRNGGGGGRYGKKSSSCAVAAGARRGKNAKIWLNVRNYVRETCVLSAAIRVYLGPPTESSPLVQRCWPRAPAEFRNVGLYGVVGGSLLSRQR